MPKYTAFGSFRHLNRWLAEVFGSNLDDAVTTILLQNVKASPCLGDFISQVDGRNLAVTENGLTIETTDASELLSVVKEIRLQRPMSTILRFACWGFTNKGIAKAKELALYGEPPNDVAVIDHVLWDSPRMESVFESLTGRVLPLGMNYVCLDKEDDSLTTDFIASVSSTEDNKNKATAYGDIGGFRDWLAVLRQRLPDLKGEVATMLSDAGFSTLKQAYDRTGNALQPENQTGVGTDGIYLVSKAPDVLLRLVIWIQTTLAYNGVALFHWCLNLGIPHYNQQRQPAGDDYLESYQLLEKLKPANGEVILTPSFVRTLKRPELLYLVRPVSSMDSDSYRALWWCYPFRMIPFVNREVGGKDERT